MYSNCGTYAGYRKHHNNKTKPCIECKYAACLYNRERYKKNNRAHDSAKYRANNLEKVRARERAKNRRRRAKQSMLYNELQVIATYGPNCYLCGLAIDFMASRRTGHPGWEVGLHIDHLIPVSKGGADVLENVRPSHGLCNLQKYANQ